MYITQHSPGLGQRWSIGSVWLWQHVPHSEMAPLWLCWLLLLSGLMSVISTMGPSWGGLSQPWSEQNCTIWGAHPLTGRVIEVLSYAQELYVYQSTCICLYRAILESPINKTIWGVAAYCSFISHSFSLFVHHSASSSSSESVRSWWQFLLMI